MAEINLKTLDDTQLATLAAVSTDLALEVKAERRRRSAYTTIEEGFSDLASASLKLDNALQGIKGTAATKAVRDSNIVSVTNRLLAAAEILGIEFKKPNLIEVLTNAE